MSRDRRAFKIDCTHYEMGQQKFRPHCYKLNREIRVSDCTDCGWYRRDYTREDLKRGGWISREGNQEPFASHPSPLELGIGGMSVEDIKRIKENE